MATYPNTTSASDVWSLRDVYKAEAGGDWPLLGLVKTDFTLVASDAVRGTTHTLDTTNVQAGDLLFAGNYDIADFTVPETAPTGWTILHQGNSTTQSGGNGTESTTYLLFRIADGTESNPDVNFFDTDHSAYIIIRPAKTVTLSVASGSEINITDNATALDSVTYDVGTYKTNNSCVVVMGNGSNGLDVTGTITDNQSGNEINAIVESTDAFGLYLVFFGVEDTPTNLTFSDEDDGRQQIIAVTCNFDK